MCQLRCSTKGQASRQLRSSKRMLVAQKVQKTVDDPTGAVQCQRSWTPLCLRLRLRKSRLLAWRRILPSFKQTSSEVAELNVDLGAQSAQQQKMDATIFEEQKILATYQGGSETSHCRRPCGDATTSAWTSRWSSTLTRSSMSQLWSDAKHCPSRPVQKTLEVPPLQRRWSSRRRRQSRCPAAGHRQGG